MRRHRLLTSGLNAAHCPAGAATMRIGSRTNAKVVCIVSGGNIELTRFCELTAI